MKLCCRLGDASAASDTSSYKAYHTSHDHDYRLVWQALQDTCKNQGPRPLAVPQPRLRFRALNLWHETCCTQHSTGHGIHESIASCCMLGPALACTARLLRPVALSRCMATSAADVETALRDQLQASDVQVVDTSGGCGASFDVAVVSEQFEGKKLLERHRMVSPLLLQGRRALGACCAWSALTVSLCAGQHSAQGAV